jgi:hypothetical protein
VTFLSISRSGKRKEQPTAVLTESYRHEESISLAKIAGDIVSQPHIALLDESDIRVNPLETFGRHLTPLARLLALKESYLTIFVGLLCGISFELVSKRLLL